jgi:hypothetical protein
MITDGGLLRVGTKDKPFEHKAIITLHGHHKSKELPVYGTKVLAVRNGTLDLHGLYIKCLFFSNRNTLQFYYACYIFFTRILALN